ncbi:MAG TPA: hypothetical protein VLI92_00885 [Candidatus Saccharimonadales bacterium]|nr:hypothetical protein [Candidatus Saccharimonadales bacterium]
MSKKDIKPAQKIQKKAKAKNNLDLPEVVLLDDDEELAPEHVVDDSIDEEVLKVLKPPKPKQTPKPVADKHDYIAELERDDDFEDT